MALLVVIAVIVVVTLGVGIVGIARIGKDRPPLKSYELPPERTPDELQRMRLAAHQARMRVVATDLETDSDTQSTESHVRARGGEESRDGARRPPQSLATDLIQFIAKVLVQLTGIPLLTGEAADPTTTSSTTMGNTAKPSLAVHGDINALHNTAEIDVLRDNKPHAASTTTATTESHWSEQESSSGNSDDESSSYDAESDSDETTATVSQLDGFVLDGVQFYATVAKLSIATTHNAIDIGLFRASAIILRERRKALEDACIHAVEQQYPDIMCLPSHASARYSSPAPSSKSLRVNGDDADAVARTQVASPTARAQLETSFLKAA